MMVIGLDYHCIFCGRDRWLPCAAVEPQWCWSGTILSSLKRTSLFRQFVQNGLHLHRSPGC